MDRLPDWLRRASDWQWAGQVILSLGGGGYVSYLAGEAQMHKYVIVLVFFAGAAFIAATWAYVAQEIRRIDLGNRVIPIEVGFHYVKNGQSGSGPAHIVQFRLYNDTDVPLFAKFLSAAYKVGGKDSSRDDALNRLHLIPSHRSAVILSPEVIGAPADSREAWLSAKVAYGKTESSLLKTQTFEILCKRVGDGGFAWTFLQIQPGHTRKA